MSRSRAYRSPADAANAPEPANPEAEARAIAGLIVAGQDGDLDTVRRFVEILGDEARVFLKPDFARVYGAALPLVRAGRLPIVPDLQDALARDDGLEALTVTLGTLRDGTYSAAAELQAAEIVRRLADARALRRRLLQDVHALDTGTDPADLRAALLNDLEVVPSPAPGPFALEEWDTGEGWTRRTVLAPPAVVSGFTYRGAVHCIAGPTGIGKTWFGLQVAVAVATGQPFAGWEVPTAAPVLYLNLELPAWELANRLKALGAPSSVLVGNLRGLNVVEPAHRAHIERRIVEVRPAVMIIDTVTRAHGLDEQDASEVQRVMAVFEAWAAQYDCAVEFVHHTRKAPAGGSWRLSLDDARGSSVWVAHSQVAVVLSQNPDDHADYHAVFKNNFLQLPPRRFQRRPDGTFEGLAWNRTTTDAELMAALDALAAPMSEIETARLLAADLQASPAAIRIQLQRLRARGRLEGRYRRHGQTVLYGVRR